MSRYLLVIAHTCAMLWKSSAANTNRIVGVAGAQHVKKQENEVNTHSDTDMVYMGGRFRARAGRGAAHHACTSRRTPSSTGASCS